MADTEWLELCGINDEFWGHIFDSTNSQQIIRLSEQIKQKNAKNDKERGCPSDTTDLSKTYLTFLNQEITRFELKTWFAINIIMGVYNSTNIYSFFQNPTDFDPHGVD